MDQTANSQGNNPPAADSRGKSTELTRSGERSCLAASVWLCAPAHSDHSPPEAVWALRTVESFSTTGERLIIRSAAAYPGLVEETAALINAAAATGRRPVALLPTPATASRTRALLPTTAARECGPDAADRPAVPAQWVTVGVGRRRPGAEVGPAALVVVLAGPVTCGARPVRRRITPRLMNAWARPLRPGGVLVVLRPPELGLRRGRRIQPHSMIVDAAHDADLAYLQHIVLVHAPTTATGGFAHPAVTRRPHAPFWPVHTDALAFIKPHSDHHPAPSTDQPITDPATVITRSEGQAKGALR